VPYDKPGLRSPTPRCLKTCSIEQRQPRRVCRPWIPECGRETTLTEAGWRVRIQRKGGAARPISPAEAAQPGHPHTPVRIERVFRAMRHMGGKLVRCMDIVRATSALNLITASDDLQRLVYFKSEAFRHSDSRNRMADSGPGRLNEPRRCSQPTLFSIAISNKTKANLVENPTT
jgi:hypothetical protein